MTTETGTHREAYDYDVALSRARVAGVEEEARRLAHETPLTFPEAVDWAIRRWMREGPEPTP